MLALVFAKLKTRPGRETSRSSSSEGVVIRTRVRLGVHAPAARQSNWSHQESLGWF
jgi:hypothetical protein